MKSNAFLPAFLGGLLGGGFVSATISSPQTQTIYWIKEPQYRWNIVLWDTVALSGILALLGIFTKKRGWYIGAVVAFFIGIFITYYLKQKYSNISEV
jgi:hypothetical protein